MIRNIKKYTKSPLTALLSIILPLGGWGGSFLLTSCSDYLEILPLNEVVLENYWTKKEDVTSVLNGCYEALAAEGCIERIGIWGEIRSDNLVQGNNFDNKQEYIEILKENLLPSNNLTKWEDLYKTINRCNTVLKYAEGVQKFDPNYTEAQMLANKAEATFIRDLCYFYLIRTFRDVPMQFEPSIDETGFDERGTYAIPATPMNEALKFLSEDLESVKDNAVLRYVDDSKMNNSETASRAYENCAKVTRIAIYTLLADIYLWRGEYDKAISCCDYVINFKKNQYKEKIAGAGLDVQETEPPAADDPLYTMDNVIITPHMGWKGLETRQRLVGVIADDIRGFFEGKPVNVVS